MNYKIEIEYDGTNYAGWQKQPNKNTVQGEIEKALEKICQQHIKITGASRTDAGVSALGQVANFHLEEHIQKKGSVKIRLVKTCDEARVSARLGLEKLRQSLNAVLPTDIWIKKINKVPDSFHARYDSVFKIYQYKIIYTPSPLQQRFAWVLGYELNLNMMQQTVTKFVKNKDYAQFCAVKDKDGRVTVKSIAVRHKKNETVITIQANRFLYKMVRRIVGALVEIGRGHRTLDDVKNALLGKKHRPLICAPAKGLVLVKVKY